MNIKLRNKLNTYVCRELFFNVWLEFGAFSQNKPISKFDAS